jgi:hypoxanthine-guanine phosphoribosyltransferase
MESKAVQHNEAQISRILNFVGQLSRKKDPLFIEDLDEIVTLSEGCRCMARVLKLFKGREEERVRFALKEICEIVFEEKGVYLCWDIKGDYVVGYDIDFGTVMVRMPIKSEKNYGIIEYI